MPGQQHGSDSPFNSQVHMASAIDGMPYDPERGLKSGPSSLNGEHKLRKPSWVKKESEYEEIRNPRQYSTPLLDMNDPVVLNPDGEPPNTTVSAF
jgi:hypothetical protein